MYSRCPDHARRDCVEPRRPNGRVSNSKRTGVDSEGGMRSPRASALSSGASATWSLRSNGAARAARRREQCRVTRVARAAHTASSAASNSTCPALGSRTLLSVQLSGLLVRRRVSALRTVKVSWRRCSAGLEVLGLLARTLDTAREVCWLGCSCPGVGWRVGQALASPGAPVQRTGRRV